MEVSETVEKKTGKKLYDYQEEAISNIMNKLENVPMDYNLLFQLPTGGGKTVIFSEIAKRYIEQRKQKVLILTHRIELCKQTSKMLNEFGVSNKVINSKIKELANENSYTCFVAMVETLNNRLQDEILDMENVGLVIIDEAHFNSFSKLFKYFEKSIILGVTATPLSSNIKLPMNENYQDLIVGDSIHTLINKGFLAEAETFNYDVNLRSLQVGINGDYTVSSSERLYTNYVMLDKLVHAYVERANGKKTLIFNNGIKTSQQVYESFKSAGLNIRHLDNTNSEQERKDILKWFKEEPNAILTSVGILTTGFDEPTVECIILNRATKSLTLYHQMIGRGSRILPYKSKFKLIDLGNNVLRFGLWDAPIDWRKIFLNPDFYYDGLSSDEDIERQFKYVMPDNIKEQFPNTNNFNFNVKQEYKTVMAERLRPMVTMDRSVEQHAQVCYENSEDVFDARLLVPLLDADIEYRTKAYSYCICKNTANYVAWLQDDYQVKLRLAINKLFDY